MIWHPTVLISQFYVPQINKRVNKAVFIIFFTVGSDFIFLFNELSIQLKNFK